MLLQSKKVDVNQKSSEDKNTALMLASIEGHLTVVVYLVQQGADINTQDKYGKTALLYASQFGHLPVVEYLVQQGATINMQNTDGKTALLLASQFGHLPVVQYLVQQGANIHMLNKEGNTAFMYASICGHLSIVQYLVQQGAVIDKKGETALSLAKTEEIKQILVEHDQKDKKTLQSPPVKLAVQKALPATASTPVEVPAAGVKADSTVAPNIPDLSPTPLAPSPLSPVPATKSDVAVAAPSPPSPVPVPATKSNSAAAIITADDRAALDSFLQSFPTSASLQRVMHTAAAHDRTLNLLVSKQKECPSLFWFYPKQPKLRNWLSNPAKCLFQDTLMMVVVCPVTLCTVQCGPDGVGWEVNLPKEWVKQWGPAILFSVYVLQTAALAGRIVGIPLPSVPGAKDVSEALGLTDMFDMCTESNLNKCLSAFSAVTKEALKQNPELQELCAGQQKRTDQADKALPVDLPMHVVDKAYKYIHKFLIKLGPLEDQLQGRMVRLMARNGDIEWVSVEGRQAWLDKKEQLLNLALQQEESPVPALSCSGWVSRKLQGRYLDTDFILNCEEILLAKGFTTEDSFACLPPDALTVSYFESIGIKELGKVGQLIALHRELNRQYCTPTTSTTSSPIRVAMEAASFTSDEKTSLLQMQNRIDTLTSELNKLRASSAQSSTGGPLRGWKGGLALELEQEQCNVNNPRTGQPYTMNELVEEIFLLRKALAQCSSSIVDVASATEERFAALPTPPLATTTDQTAKKGWRKR